MEQIKVKPYQITFKLHKQYFDKGYGLTSYLKSLLLVVGIGAAVKQVSALSIILVGLIYGVVCYIAGWWWIKYGWWTAQIEVGNMYNLFVDEMRKNYKGKEVK